MQGFKHMPECEHFMMNALYVQPTEHAEPSVLPAAAGLAPGRAGPLDAAMLSEDAATPRQAGKEVASMPQAAGSYSTVAAAPHEAGGVMEETPLGAASAAAPMAMAPSRPQVRRPDKASAERRAWSVMCGHLLSMAVGQQQPPQLRKPVGRLKRQPRPRSLLQQPLGGAGSEAAPSRKQLRRE